METSHDGYLLIFAGCASNHFSPAAANPILQSYLPGSAPVHAKVEGRRKGVGGVFGLRRRHVGIMTAGYGLAASRYVRVKKFAELTGYTEKAIYHKIENGTWLLGCHYRRAPDGHICIDMEGFYRWVEEATGPASNR